MSSRSTVRKLKIASRPAAKQAKSHKLARIAKFPKVGKHAQKTAAPAKKAPARSAPPPPPAPAKKASHVPALTPAKQVQQPKQSLARSFYWSELRVGDDLPPLTKPAIDRVQIVRYAAASGDFNRLHLDEPFAHALGFPGLFAPGMLAMGFVGQLLTAWLRRGHVRRLAARFVKIVWPGDELTCRGRIAELRRDAGACYADVELWAENQKGELVLRGQATCELYESPASGGGDGGGLLFALQSPSLPAVQPQSRGQKQGAPSRPPKPGSRKR
jgi:acyl dehydratase